MEQKKKLNELIEIINEKDDILECQEDVLVKENKKFVKLKNAYAQEVEKCKNLSKELSICHILIPSLRTENDNLVSRIEELNVCNDSISCLKNENAKLNAKIVELSTCKTYTSNVDHITICTRCRDDHEMTSGAPSGMTMRWSRLFLDHLFFIIPLRCN
jgi:DNA repair exonuclease SbcCD ATPase subunit